jgi:nicotinate-nucleotide adenylyltransferase
LPLGAATPGSLKIVPPENLPMFHPGRAGSSVIVCPMQVERKAAESCGRPVPVIQCGIGRDAIERAFARIDEMPERPRHAVLFGIAGGLREPCDRETAWVIDRVVDAATGASATSPTARLAPPKSVASVGHADTIIATPADRVAFASRTGASLVDMECWAFAQEAAKRGMAWTIVRGVSDGPLDEMPIEVLDLVDADGNPKVAAAATAVLKSPSLGAKLMALQSRSTRALTRAQALLTHMLDAVDGSPVACSIDHPALIMGGTFDPPHRRHLGMLIEACHALSASSAIIVPAAANPLKDAQAAPPAVRWEMLQAALRDPSMPRTSAAVMTSGCELERGGTSYTIDTLRALLPLIPGSSEHGPRSVRWLIGSDALMQVDRWRDWRAILDLARPAVAIRPPHAPDEVRAWLAEFSDRYALGDTTDWILPLASVDLSSTDLRAALGRGETPDGILPAVAEIARHHRLYRA